MAINFLNTVAVDDNVLFVDTINDRVGIGTDSPTAPLHIEGGTNNEVLKIEADVSPFVRWVKSGSDVGFLQFTSTSAYLSNMSNGSFFFRTNNTDKMTITSAGNVGIGTTNPQRLLSISNSDTATTPQLLITQNGAGDAVIGFNRPGYQGWAMGIDSSIGNNFEIHNSSGGVDSSSQLAITPIGNVGIGTTNPSRTLSVEGTAFLRDELAITVTDPGTNLTKDSQLYLQSKGNQAGNVRASNWFFQTESDSYWGNSGFTISKGYDGGSAVEYLRILSNGNVGIGTTSPDEKLEVAGNIKIQSALLSNQENTDIDSAAAEVVAQVAHATYTAAFFDFVVKKGTNVRSGTVYACHNGDTTPLVEFTETSTNDLGDTSDVVLSVDISGANMRLLATVASDDWSVKTLIRAI